MRRFVSRLLVPALLLAPSIGRAQATADAPAPAPQAAPATTADSSSAPAVRSSLTGPVAESQAVALKTRPAPAPAPRTPRGNTSENRALMIVGGVGLLVGAVIGGDAGTLVMLGSAGVGLWGLYRFLN